MKVDPLLMWLVIFALLFGFGFWEKFNRESNYAYGGGYY